MHLIRRKQKNKVFYIFSSNTISLYNFYISTDTSIIDLQTIFDSFNLGNVLTMFVSHNSNILQFTVNWNTSSPVYKLFLSNSFHKTNIPDSNITIY